MKPTFKMTPSIDNSNTTDNGMLQFSTIELNEEYRKKWNISSRDFIVLSINGEPLRDTLYRKGGFNTTKPTDKYFLLLKYSEDFYGDEITKDKKKKPHLIHKWCILDNSGNEKFVAEEYFNNISIIPNSIIYVYGNKYYNIETGLFYGYAFTRIMSQDYIFLDTRCSDAYSSEAVLKISKKDGTFEVFPK